MIGAPLPPRRSLACYNPAVPKRAPLTYALALCALASAALACWPIVALDSDVWMYLAYGRELFSSGAVPRESFFSFLEPPVPWVNYTWLFEALVYGVHRAAGYAGLALLRAALFAAFTGLLALFLLEDNRRWGAAAALALLAAAFLLRAVVVRPHLASYLLLAAFLFVLERRPKSVRWLPALALLWANVHGISWPAMTLIVCAYAVEDLLDGRRPSLWLLACLPCVLLTPFGARLLALPFVSLEGTSRLIQELTPWTPSDLFSLSLSPRGVPARTGPQMVLWAAGAAALAQALSRRARPAHLILFLGGLAMLAKGGRLLHECALLSLPLLRWLTTRPASPNPATLAGLAALLLLPFLQLGGIFRHRPRWPVSERHLPRGVSAFLESAPPGKVMNHPVTGGYLAWRVHPRHKILMDMNISHFFSAEDAAMVRRAYANEEDLKAFVARWRPDYISAPLEGAHHGALLSRLPQYSLVFFDDTDALYADLRRHPGLEALPVDPFRPRSLDPGRPGSPVPGWLARMIETDPECLRTRLLAAGILSRRGEWEGTLAHGEALIRAYPELAAGHLVSGDALRALGRPSEARKAYREALAREEPEKRPALQRRLALLALSEKDLKEAYRRFRRAVDPYAPETSRRDLYHYVSLAVAVGREREAEKLLRILYPHGEAEAAFQADLRRWGPYIRE